MFHYSYHYDVAMRGARKKQEIFPPKKKMVVGSVDAWLPLVNTLVSLSLSLSLS